MLKKLLNIFKPKKVYSVTQKLFNEHIHYQKDDVIIIFRNGMYNIIQNVYYLESFLDNKLKFNNTWYDINMFENNHKSNIIDYFNYSYGVRKSYQYLNNENETYFDNYKILNFLLENTEYIKYNDKCEIKLKSLKPTLNCGALDIINERYLLVRMICYNTNHQIDILEQNNLQYEINNSVFKNFNKNLIKHLSGVLLILDINDIENIHFPDLESRKLDSLSNDYINILPK